MALIQINNAPAQVTEGTRLSDISEFQSRYGEIMAERALANKTGKVVVILNRSDKKFEVFPDAQGQFQDEIQHGDNIQIYEHDPRVGDSR
jgi:hypothetical protein